MEVVGYLKDSMIEDWDVFEKVLDYTYNKCIKSESEFHPILMSEAPVRFEKKASFREWSTIDV